MQILIVEDEPMHRRVIKSIIKKNRPEIFVCETANGHDAIGYIQKHNFDIIFTDIKMPTLDGLELLKLLKKMNYSTYFIIISGFAYFEYAQTAIHYGAYDFLLKPANPAKILQIINEIEKITDTDKDISESGQQSSKTMQKIIAKNRTAYSEYLLNKLMHNSISVNEKNELNNILELSGKGFIAVCNLYTETSYSLCSNIELKIFINKVMILFEEIMSPVASIITFDHERSQASFVSIIRELKDHMLDDIFIMNHLQLFIKKINMDHKTPLVIGTGIIINNILDDSAKSYSAALNAIDYSFYYGKNSVIKYSMVPSYTSLNAKAILFNEYSLSDSLYQGKSDEALKIIDCIFEYSTEEYIPNPLVFKEYISRMFYNLVSVLHKYIDQDFINEVTKEIEKIIISSTHSELKHQCYKIIKQIIHFLKQSNECQDMKRIEKCKNFIDNYYNQNISLDLLAEKFGFNASYFSSYFKKYAGINLSDYIFDTRMKNAVKLLVSEDMKIYEIAQKVGYSNPKYFIRVFKKKFGVSPDKYKRINKK